MITFILYIIQMLYIRNRLKSNIILEMKQVKSKQEQQLSKLHIFNYWRVLNSSHPTPCTSVKSFSVEYLAPFG